MGISLFFLTSGLFLGFTLGANDAANVFGTAVSTKMVRFRTAAILCAVFVLLGAVVSGSGAAHTLGKLGSVNRLAGSFTVAVAAGITVLAMTRLSLPVSTSQAIVGAIIGWNIFSGSRTDYSALYRIVGSWVASMVLAGVLAGLMYLLIKKIIAHSRIHLLRIDQYTRTGLILVGIFGSFSLGANNIANVMGVFVPVEPFPDTGLLSGTQILFALGALAIGLGVATYSKRVMNTVGSGIFTLSPVCAFIVVCATSLVLFLFASARLKAAINGLGLPWLPLVPVSSSQAVVGAVLGIGVAKSARNIRFGMLGKISLGWLITPAAAGILAFILLFIMQNVFLQEVFG